MALFEDAFKGGNLLTGLAIGIGALVLIPVATTIIRPLAKTVIKAGMMAFEEGSKAVTALGMATGDIINEAREENRAAEHANMSHEEKSIAGFRREEPATPEELRTPRSPSRSPILDQSGMPIDHEDMPATGTA